MNKIIFLFLLLSGCSSSKPLIDKNLSELSVLDIFPIAIFIILLVGTFFVKEREQRQMFQSWLIIYIMIVVIGYFIHHLFN